MAPSLSIRADVCAVLHTHKTYNSKLFLHGVWMVDAALKMVKKRLALQEILQRISLVEIEALFFRADRWRKRSRGNYRPHVDADH